MLLEVCKNPTQPGFNHFLFESVAALVRFTAAAGGGGAGGVEALEQQLFPAFQLVLQQDVQARRPRRGRHPTPTLPVPATGTRAWPHPPACVRPDRCACSVYAMVTVRLWDGAWQLARAPPARAPRRSSTRTCSRSSRS
jgi:hypothetical protein